MPEDVRLYHAGAVRFDSLSLGDEALGARIVVEASNADRPECLTSVQVGPFQAPELTLLDLQMLSEASERGKKEAENNREEQVGMSARGQMREKLGEVLSEILDESDHSYESAFLSQDDIAKSEILREFLIPSWCSWGPHLWGTGPIQDWKLDSRNTALAAEVLERTSRSLIELSDNYLKCSRFVNVAASYATFGSPEPSAHAVALARDACEGFPVAMKMVEVSELVAAGRMEKNSHSWLELTEAKAKFGGEDHR
jgi:hypothetical protein